MVRQARRRLTPSLLAASLAVVVSCLHATPANACSCKGSLSGPQTCQERWTHAAVFAGRVVRIDPATWPREGQDIWPWPDRRVHLTVTEGFAGVPAGEVDVFTGAGGGGSCGYVFEIGHVYLIYADKLPNGSLETTICTPTKKIQDAAGDLAYLRAVPVNAPRDGRLIGLVLKGTDHSAPLQQPYAGVRIVAEGQGLKRGATVGADGKYEIRLPVGRYRVHAEVDAGLYTNLPGEVELKDTRGCAVADFAAYFDGHVSGRVVSTGARPVPHLAVELTSVDPDNTWNKVEGRADPKGRFDLEHVAPGRYTLAFRLGPITPVFFPGTPDQSAARVIEVGPSAKVAIGDFGVPSTVRFVTATGVVTDSVGHAVAGARVHLEADESELGPLGPPVVTGADGRFAIAVVDGARYRLAAEYPPMMRQPVEYRTFLASADMAPVVLTPIVR